MGPKKLNILDLHRTISSKQQKRVECFDKVLELCHKKILHHSENKKTRLFYEVPEFQLGYPLYDINECIQHVMAELKSNGFISTYYFPKYIYVSWDLEEIDQQKATNKKQFANKRIDPLDFKYKPSGKLTLEL